MFVYIHDKNAGKLLNLMSFQTTILSNRDWIFLKFILLGQIGTEKLQNSLFKIMCLYRLHIFRKIDKQIVV